MTWALVLYISATINGANAYSTEVVSPFDNYQQCVERAAEYSTSMSHDQRYIKAWFNCEERSQ